MNPSIERMPCGDIFEVRNIMNMSNAIEKLIERDWMSAACELKEYRHEDVARNLPTNKTNLTNSEPKLWYFEVPAMEV